jgi:hypothetical protein
VSTVLIAGSDYLGPMKERDEFKDALAFADTDALRALEAITRQKPAVVALERMFAATSRGAALINRIKADPSLAGCEIRVVAHDHGYARTPAGATPPAPAAQAAAAQAAPVVPPSPAPPLDQRGTRRAPRFPIVEEVEVLVDGNPAVLVNLSVVGAQVVSPTILKPNQRVRFSLPDAVRPLRFSAGVAWAAFEMPKTGVQYRAGIEFYDADPDGVGKFIDSNKR